jgi:hypothetical protein
MASNLKIAQNTAQTQANALVGAFTNSSLVSIYSGSQPATPETALSGNTLLAQIVLPASSAFSSTNGVMTAAAIANVTIAATGTAAFFRWTKADGVTVIADGSVGTSSADMILNSVSLVSGAVLTTSSFTFTIPSS